MNKKEKGIIFIFLIVVILVTGVVIHHKKQIKKEEDIHNYLVQRYNGNFQVKKVGWLDDTAICYPENNENLSFVVFWGKTSDDYSDTYLKMHLEDEAKTIISKEIDNYYINYKCSTYLLFNPPMVAEKRLYSFYEKFQRPLSWYDDECNEILSDIHLIFYNIIMDKETASQIIEIIDKLPIKYKDIYIYQNSAENVIFEVNK